MDKIELKRRTQRFAIDVIKFVEQLQNNRSLNVLTNQLLRCSSSVGANYRLRVEGNQQPTLLIKL
jgi:four helix bundle protein